LRPACSAVRRGALGDCDFFAPTTLRRLVSSATDLLISATRGVISCSSASLSPAREQVDARDDHKVKLQTGWRHRTDEYYDCLRGSRGSRGRQGARDASIDAGLACARLSTGLGSASSRLARRLYCRFCRRVCGPALYGRWKSRPARARASFSMRPCDRARPACAAGDGACHGRVVERSMCDFRSREGRLSGATLNIGHTGSVWSLGCGLRAHVTA